MILLAAIANTIVLSGPIIAAEPSALQVVEDPTSITIRAGNRTVLEYRTTAAPRKPYVRELSTPGGVQILRDAVADHKHHHGLMFAIKVEGIDFWSETEKNGTEKPRGHCDTAAGSFLDGSCTRITQTLDWTDPHGKKLLVERREVGAVALTTPAPVTLVLWNSELSPAAGGDPVKLGGDQYFGLGMRFLKSMDSGGRFFNSSKQPGENVGGSFRLVAAKWSAYTASVDGKPVTAAIFDHPSNPRYPNKMFTMSIPFPYLSATLNLWKEPLSLTAGAKLKLSYAVAVWDGETSAEQVESLYEKWSKAR